MLERTNRPTMGIHHSPRYKKWVDRWNNLRCAKGMFLRKLHSRYPSINKTALRPQSSWNCLGLTMFATGNGSWYHDYTALRGHHLRIASANGNIEFPIWLFGRVTLCLWRNYVFQSLLNISPQAQLKSNFLIALSAKRAAAKWTWSSVFGSVNN